MALFVYRNRNSPNTRGTAGWYETMTTSDPNIPAGFVYCGSDGAPDEALQKYVAGVNSGGWPPYTGDQSQVTAQPSWPNGILGAMSGNRTAENPYGTRL
jgi:hypothetical protein